MTVPVPLILGFAEYATQTERLARALDVPHTLVETHRFPDGESKVRLPLPLPERVIFCRSLHRPNDKLIELLLAARTAREHGARHLTLAAPYFCYMRQDSAFQPGEAVSQRIIGAWLAECFDAVVTVDPHLHRVRELREAVPAARATALHAAPLLAEFLRGRLHDARQPLLLGPDEESGQWVADIARRTGWDHAVACKQRLGDTRVEIELPGVAIQGRTVILVDDIASTGHTLAQLARLAKTRGAGRIACAITHALFAPGAEALLAQAGVGDIWSTDSVPHSSNVIPLAPLLAAALKE